MFSIDKDNLAAKSETSTKKIAQDVLNVVSLSDDANYNDLWDEIVNELQLGG